MKMIELFNRFLYCLVTFQSVLSAQIVTDVICIFTYLFGLNVTIDCSLVLGRLIFLQLPCTLVSLTVLVWKSSILFMIGCTNWLRRGSQRHYAYNIYRTEGRFHVLFKIHLAKVLLRCLSIIFTLPCCSCDAVTSVSSRSPCLIA